MNPGDERDTDPFLVLEPRDTFRDELDAVNDRNPWIRWSALVVGILMIAGGIVRACW
ncbi:MAG TPA: hypothetical protein VGH28_10620 [Polyangiaceae bacterium]